MNAIFTCSVCRERVGECRCGWRSESRPKQPGGFISVDSKESIQNNWPLIQRVRTANLNATTEKSSDPVRQPNHYTAGGIETIDILKAKLTAEQFEGFCVGNCIKYLTRYRHKNGVQDLKKAQTYLERLIALLEEKR